LVQGIRTTRGRPFHDLGIAERLVATDEDAVSGMEAADYFVVLSVLTAKSDRDATGAMACFVNHHDPLSARLCVKTAARNDKPAFRLAKFDLQAKGLSGTEFRV
jgi:hypothetical protein